VGDAERAERFGRQLEWLKTRSTGEMPRPPSPPSD